jgi:hypothetical protein
MTDYEKKMAELIVAKFDEDEDVYPYYARRVYLDLNGVVSSHGEETDILFVQYSVQYTTNDESKSEFIVLFISSEDDMCQDFIYLSELTDEERAVIVPKIMEQLTTEK